MNGRPRSQTNWLASLKGQRPKLSDKTPAGELIRHMIWETDTNKANHIERSYALGSGQDKGNSYFRACSASFVSCLLLLILIQDKIKMWRQKMLRIALMIKLLLLLATRMLAPLFKFCVFFFMNSGLFLFQGEMTGVCVKSTNTCEVLAWCPVEDDNGIPTYAESLNYLCCDSCSDLCWMFAQSPSV